MTKRAALQRRFRMGSVFFEAAIGSILIRYGLAKRSLPWLCARLGIELGSDRAEPKPSSKHPGDPEVKSAVRVAVRVSKKFWKTPTCLQQSLLVGYLLRAKAPVLRIGWWRPPHGNHGHAWIEINGVPVSGLANVGPDWTEKISVLGRGPE